MKKAQTLCFLLVMCSQFLLAQDYSPMAIEDAHWLMFFPGPIWDAAPYEYYIKGDTTINDKTYKKVYYRHFYQDPVSHITPYPYIVDYDTLHAAIRDDTLQRKVFLYRFNDYGTGDTFGNCPLLEEFLLYDFDLEVGDTLSGLCLFYGGVGDVVIDSIYTSEHHDYSLKTFLFHSYLGDLQDIEFLERIGFHDSGIFNNDFPFLSFNPVLHEYCIGDDCDYLLSAKEPIGKSTRLRVYPNPATSHIRLALSDYQPGNNHRLHITDSMGKVFLDEALSFGESTHTVSVADWPTGVYFIQYFADGVLWEVERIVVLH